MLMFNNVLYCFMFFCVYVNVLIFVLRVLMLQNIVWFFVFVNLVGGVIWNVLVDKNCKLKAIILMLVSGLLLSFSNVSVYNDEC